jgi:cytochrome c peroxidase
MKKISLLMAVAVGAGFAALLVRGAKGGSVVPPTPSVEGFSAVEIERILQHSPLPPPPADPTNGVADLPEAARLGQRLFFDPRLSGKGDVSCATCHDPARGFADGRALSDRFPLERNIPALWNVAYNRWFFWDGRADSLWSQALQPIENPREQAGTRLQVAHLLLEDPALRESYGRVFGAAPDLSDASRFPPRGGPRVQPEGDPLRSAWTKMTPEDRSTVDRVYSNAAKAIAAYERRLLSRNSAFDVFVDGVKSGDAAKRGALSSQAKAGLRLFVGKANCRLCHSGPAFTDGEFHNIGIPPARGGLTPDRYSAIDEVRKDAFNTKGAFSDDPSRGAEKLDFLVRLQDSWGQIKTPGLRNVARSAPYMHQGQFRTLKDAVEFYSTLEGMIQAGHHERAILSPLLLSTEEVASLVAFLESLTDEGIDGSLLRPPPP